MFWRWFRSSSSRSAEVEELKKQLADCMASKQEVLAHYRYLLMLLEMKRDKLQRRKNGETARANEKEV